MLGEVVVDKLDDGHFGAVTVPAAETHDAGVAARTVDKTGRNLVEEAAYDHLVRDHGENLAARR